MRLGAFKYIHPLRYVGIKLLADAFYGAFRTRARLDEPPLACQIRDAQIYQPNSETAKIVAYTWAQQVAPRPRRLRGSVPMFDHAPGRPAMIRRNGGLRGSLASRQRRKWA